MVQALYWSGGLLGEQGMCPPSQKPTDRQRRGRRGGWPVGRSDFAISGPARRGGVPNSALAQDHLPKNQDVNRGPKERKSNRAAQEWKSIPGRGNGRCESLEAPESVACWKRGRDGGRDSGGALAPWKGVEGMRWGSRRPPGSTMGYGDPHLRG